MKRIGLDLVSVWMGDHKEINKAVDWKNVFVGEDVKLCFHIIVWGKKRVPYLFTSQYRNISVAKEELFKIINLF